GPARGHRESDYRSNDTTGISNAPVSAPTPESLTTGEVSLVIRMRRARGFLEDAETPMDAMRFEVSSAGEQPGLQRDRALAGAAQRRRRTIKEGANGGTLGPPPLFKLVGEFGFIEGCHEGQAAVALAIVQAVADGEPVGDLEADVAADDVRLASGRL